MTDLNELMFLLSKSRILFKQAIRHGNQCIIIGEGIEFFFDDNGKFIQVNFE